MAIPTSRTHEAAKLHFSPEHCNGCGLRVQVCKDFSIAIVDGRVQAATTSIFGCIGCGYCMAICPQEAITVTGRCLSADDLTELPGRGNGADYQSLLQRRRSIREFKDKVVEADLIDKVLEAVRTAPMGLPPSVVHILVYSYTGAMARGEDLVTYDAPVALYFYGSPLCDPADPIVAATYAILAAESLGLGTCMLGGMHPLIQNGRAARRFREQQGIRHASREGLIVIMGHPRVVYHKGIRRSLAAVDNYIVV